ncbi:unnamed protein product [Protopolystoma xenopodis]|uniref:RIM zinc finger domain-containing protein n=1 Tax=Protopolystoma xenopodis TaxID=117903 RepID=A0A3S5B169_9PLAT|nr:unnamed protein product [Protopolystoma xenopodis]
MHVDQFALVTRSADKEETVHSSQVKSVRYQATGAMATPGTGSLSTVTRLGGVGALGSTSSSGMSTGSGGGRGPSGEAWGSGAGSLLSGNDPASAKINPPFASSIHVTGCKMESSSTVTSSSAAGGNTTTCSEGTGFSAALTNVVAGLTGVVNEVTAAVGDAKTCEICQKVKFTQGSGHICHNCRKKTCARCGFPSNTAAANSQVPSSWLDFSSDLIQVLSALAPVAVLRNGHFAEMPMTRYRILMEVLMR